MSETVNAVDVSLQEPKHAILNVKFKLPSVVVRKPTSSKSWSFNFDDSDTLLDLSVLKKKLVPTTDYLLAIVLLEDPHNRRIYRPHRFVVTMQSSNGCVGLSDYLKSDGCQALTVALYRVQSEMEMRLRQWFFREADPRVTYGRIVSRSGKQIVMTHISEFERPQSVDK